MTTALSEPRATPGPAEPTEVLRLDNVRKIYRMGDQEVRALAGVTMTLDRGVFVAIMGASGSGKSTLLNILGCLDRPTEGDFFLDGRNVSNLSDDELSEIRLQKLGFVFQSFHLIPQLTVRENIELPLSYQGWDRNDAANRAEFLADKVGLADRLGHRPRELSGGQQQRVAIARSLANDPKLVLADEPTGNLDSKTTTQIMDILAELNAAGTTIIMVTHEPDIASYCPTHVHMRDGLVDHFSGPGVRVPGLEPDAHPHYGEA